MELVLKADNSKASLHHQFAAGIAMTAMQHVLDHAPSGAHVDVPQDIKAGQYTVTLSKDGNGHVHVTFVPGTVA